MLREAQVETMEQVLANEFFEKKKQVKDPTVATKYYVHISKFKEYPRLDLEATEKVSKQLKMIEEDPTATKLIFAKTEVECRYPKVNPVNLYSMVTSGDYYYGNLTCLLTSQEGTLEQMEGVNDMNWQYSYKIVENKKLK